MAFENNVQGTLHSNVAIAATTIDVVKAGAVYNTVAPLDVKSFFAFVYTLGINLKTTLLLQLCQL